MQKVFMIAKEVQDFRSQKNDCISVDQRNESRTDKARLSSTKR